MAKIHGLVYLLVGLLVSFLSWKLNYEKLMFFFYIGLIFVFIGVIKLITGLMKKKNNEVDAHKKHGKMPQAHRQVKYCHQCGSALSPHHRFCSRCGARI